MDVSALGVCAWTAGTAMVSYVECRFAGRVSGLRVLELGAGTDVTAVALARLGAQVTVINFLQVLLGPAAEEVLPCELRAPFDLVIGAEITHNEAGFQPLFLTLRALSDTGQHSSPIIFIAETLCNAQQPHFWALVGRHFMAREVAAFHQHDPRNAHNIYAPVRIFELSVRRGTVANCLLATTPFVCPRVATVTSVLDSLQRYGACVLAECGTSCEDATKLPRQVFGQRLQAAPEAAEVSDRVLAVRGILKEESFRAHTDGHAYGDLFPDYFLLLCSRACRSGGASFLVDGYAVLDSLASDPTTAWVPSALEARAVDQTSRLQSISPVVLRAPCGRRALRCRMPGPPTAFAAQRVAAESDNPEADAAMLQAYHATIEAASTVASRFALSPGEALLVDNYRMFHGREPYWDEDRLLWRVWIWTDGARGVPAGDLRSTPGDVSGTVSEDCPHDTGGAVASSYRNCGSIGVLRT